MSFGAFYAFWVHFIFLLLVCQKFLEPNRHFTLKTDSDVVTVVLVPVNHRHQDAGVSVWWCALLTSLKVSVRY